MRDLFNFGAAVLLALLFAVAQLGDLYGSRGAKFTQASLSPLTPSLTDYAAALGDGTVLKAALAQLAAARAALARAQRG